MNESGQEENREESGLVVTGSGSNGMGKASGPRTDLGKQRAGRNAIKHGVFSKVVVLPEESRAEYAGLLAKLREDLQPEGALEELLVEKLATTAWRQRRLLLAESAEIQKNMGFVEWDQRNQEFEDCDLQVEPCMGRLIQYIHRPHVLQYCLNLLARLREEIDENGINAKENVPLLVQIYGARIQYHDHAGADLYDFYVTCLCMSEVPEEERLSKGYASPEQCQKNIIIGIEKEIDRLKRFQKLLTSINASRTQLEVQSHNVPDSSGLDRLLRYEASIERSFDRTLTQLERLQRMRLGQSVLPKLEVQHSLS